MAKRDMLMGILEDMGYKPQIDQDGDLLIRHEMKSIYVIVGDEDDPRVVLLLPQFVEVEEDEIVLVLTACNNVTREIKMAKVFLERSLKAVSASCEFYYTDEDVIRLNLSHALTILGMVRSIFRNTKAELAGN